MAFDGAASGLIVLGVDGKEQQAKNGFRNGAVLEKGDFSMISLWLEKCEDRSFSKSIHRWEGYEYLVQAISHIIAQIFELKTLDLFNRKSNSRLL